MKARSQLRGSWHLLALALVGAGVIAAGVLEIGTPASSARTSREIVTAARGVVQSTVTGTGNVEPSTDVEANFQTSGTLQNVYIKTGDHVVKGQLIATLDPAAAQLTLDQAEQSLTAAEDQLTNAEDETASTTASTEVDTGATQFISYQPATATSTSAQTAATTTMTTTTTRTITAPVVSTPSTTRTTTTSTAAASTPATGRSGASGSSGASGGSGTGSASPSGSGQSGSAGSASSGSGGSSATSTTSAATIAANIASAQASVDGAEATVHNAETALHETHLYAPAGGTVVSVQDISPGDSVSSGSSSSAGSSSTASSSTAGTGTTSAGSLGGTASSSTSSSSSSGFAEIVDIGKMTMTVAFSESDISKIKLGQSATVTLDALTGVELGAHVTAISTIGTTSSSVVSYNATLTLDQRDSSVKAGMSASASVITRQVQGVTLPNSAVTGTGSVSSVNVMRNGKQVSTPVVVGLRGDSRTQIVSGLSSGAQVVVTTTLPSLSSSTASSSSGSSGTLGGATGVGAGGFGGAPGFGGGGLARRFGGAAAGGG